MRDVEVLEILSDFQEGLEKLRASQQRIGLILDRAITQISNRALSENSKDYSPRDEGKREPQEWNDRREDEV